MSDPVPANAVYAASRGVVANATQDQTAAINAALRSLKAGQTLVLAPGSYTISATLLMQSGTGLYGTGATLHAAAAWRGTIDADPAAATGYAMLANANFAAKAITDKNLTVDGLAFDYGTRTDGGTHAIRFRQASDIKILNCSFNGGDDATALLACDRTLVQGCTATNTINAAYDHWEGTSNATVTGSSAIVASGSGILFTGVGSNGDDHTARNVTATNNIISGPFGVENAGILADALSPGSAVQGVTFTGNTVDGLNADGSGIGTDGKVSNVTITGNTVKNVAGFALFTLTDDGNQPQAVQIASNTLRGNASLVDQPDVAQAERAASSGLIWLSGPQSSLTTSGPCIVAALVGAATVTAGGAASQSVTVYADGSTLNFINGRSASSVYGGAGRITVAGAAGGGLFQGGTAGRNVIAAGIGAATIIGGGAGDLLQAGGSAGDLIVASAGNTTIQGSGSSGNDVLVGGAGNDSIVAGAGHVSIVGGAGRDTVVGGAGSAVVQMGTDGGQFVAGTGLATVLGGASVGGGNGGVDLYSFIKGGAGGIDFIAGFRVGVDHIALQGYGVTAVTDAVRTAESGGGSSQLHLSDGTQITLLGVPKVTSLLFS